MGVEVYANGTQTVAVPAGESIAVSAIGDNPATVYQDVGYPNIPAAWRLIGTVLNTETVFGPFTPAASIRIDAGANPIYYEVGASPVVGEPIGNQVAGVTPWSTAGLSAAQGGSVGLTGGTSSTSANAGGAVINTGGVPGATGVGGAVSNTGGAGGATSGAGGAAVNRGGAGTAGNSAGGAASNIGGAGQGSAAGGAATTTGGVGGATGAGGAASVVGGAGGATSGKGGAVSVTGGAGSGGNAAGGSVILSGGAKNGSGLDGAVINRATFQAFKQAAPAAKTTTATLTAAEVVGGLITANQGASGAATYTFPTGTDLAAALPSDFTTGDSFLFRVTNISTDAAEDVTIAGGTDTTLVGSGFVASNNAGTDKSAGTFLIRMTGATTFSFYRVG